MARPEKPSWDLEEGAEIVPGRTALKPLGGGSRYEVYLVWDDYLYSLAVAKLLRPDRVEDERSLRELRREAEILDATSHPVLVRAFDAVLDGPRPHLLIEHLEGPSLRRLIKRGGPLEQQQILPLALHVAAALHYMRNRGLVHLDVKPDNIIMGVPPRLIDLSVARTFERAEELARPVGTDAYMAPEQCDPEALGPVGSAADVWGLGATLFHAVSGEVPFPRPSGARDSEDPDVRFPQLSERPGALSRGLPGELRSLVESTLIPSASDRPTAAEVAQALEPLVADLPRRVKLGRRGR